MSVSIHTCQPGLDNGLLSRTRLAPNVIYVSDLTCSSVQPSSTARKATLLDLQRRSEELQIDSTFYQVDWGKKISINMVILFVYAFSCSTLLF